MTKLLSLNSLFPQCFLLGCLHVFISTPVSPAHLHSLSLPSFLSFSWLLSSLPLPWFLILLPTSSLSAPSVHGHMLLCRWVPVSCWLPLVTVYFARHGLIQLSEGTARWAELWCSALPEAEIQWLWNNDSWQQRAKHRGWSISFRADWDSEGWTKGGREGERDQMD